MADERLSVPVKVQQLADSLQLISGQLNSVLGALGSLTHKQTPPPLTTPRMPRPSWAWPAHPSSSLANGLLHRATDSLQTRWSGLSSGETRTHTHTHTSPAASSEHHSCLHRTQQSTHGVLRIHAPKVSAKPRSHQRTISSVYSKHTRLCFKFSSSLQQDSF